MSLYDEDLKNELSPLFEAGLVKAIEDASSCFDVLGDVLGIPEFYSDIYQIPGVIVSDVNRDDMIGDYLSFFQECVGEEFDHKEYIYCGDGVTDCAYKLTSGLPQFVIAISHIPQHHFFLPEDKAFVIYFGFEGSMVFVDLEKLSPAR
jgi:hypothetical protein